MTTEAILLVEDDADSAFFFTHTVEKLGIPNQVRVAKDGRQALDYLAGTGEFADREKHPFPGMVILDLKLPHCSGFEVLQTLRQRPETQKLIVLMLTSSASDEDVARAYTLGVNAYLVKPLSLEKLGEIVHSIQSFWLTHNHPPPAGQPGGATNPFDGFSQ